MKKIGIITFHSAHNYGAMLQVYALQKILNNNGVVKVINYKNPIIDYQYRIIKLDKSNLKSFVCSIKNNILYLRKNIKRYKSFNNFMNDKIELTSVYTTEDDLKKNPPQFDIYVTGSDQVWNSQITQGLKDSYTLLFGDNSVKRISYAASIGNELIESNEAAEYKEKISNIDRISVREETAKKVLKKIINKPIEVVLDPTLLLKKEEWENETKSMKSLKGKYILAYVVAKDEEYYKILNELSSRTRLKIVHFSKNNIGYNNVLKSAYTEGPLEFVNLIKNAEYVVCTSFHATVFSIIFNKKFFVVPHRKTGARVTNLLDKLNISNRAVNSLEEFNKMDYNSEINYKEVNSILENERQKSIDWLNNSINN